MVTGGTGSFGNAVINRFLEFDCAEIIIFSRDEKKQDDMRSQYKSDRLRFVIGDIRDRSSLDRALSGVDYVFHAAALKQVPACEFYPQEAINTNILGANNLIQSAIENQVKKVILLSTDKAVYPINAMGMSKALMEKLVSANARAPRSRKNNTVFCLTRYGNVMASRGSVIPLFVSQILDGKPLTVTDPNMTRFLMSLEESVDLVVHAFLHGNDGDLFVQKSPASTVECLAQALIELFGSKSEIKLIGTRHSEKLYETLVSREEMVKAEDMGDYFRVPADVRDLNYHKYLHTGDTRTSMVDDYNSHNTEILNKEQVKEKLLELEYIRSQLKLVRQ
jgi:UDP-glucose 4-epimerase